MQAISIKEWLSQQKTANGTPKSFTGATVVIPNGIVITFEKAQPFLKAYSLIDNDGNKKDGYYLAYQGKGSDGQVYDLSYGMLFSAQYTLDEKKVLRRCTVALADGLTEDNVAIVSGKVSTSLAKNAHRVTGYENRKPVFSEDSEDLVIFS